MGGPDSADGGAPDPAVSCACRSAWHGRVARTFTNLGGIDVGLFRLTFSASGVSGLSEGHPVGMCQGLAAPLRPRLTCLWWAASAGVAELGLVRVGVKRPQTEGSPALPQVCPHHLGLPQARRGLAGGGWEGTVMDRAEAAREAQEILGLGNPALPTGRERQRQRSHEKRRACSPGQTGPPCRAQKAPGGSRRWVATSPANVCLSLSPEPGQFPSVSSRHPRSHVPQ